VIPGLLSIPCAALCAALFGHMALVPPAMGQAPPDTAVVDTTQLHPTDADLMSLLDPEKFLAFLEIVPGPETFKGKGTDARFAKEAHVKTSHSQADLVALGSGVRKKFVFKVYEGVAYAEKGVSLGSDPYDALVHGNFAKRIHMYFERDVDGGKIRGAYREGLDKVLGKRRDMNLDQDIEVFLGFFEDTGVKDGQTIDLVWIPGEGLFTMVNDESFPPVNSPQLATALWAIWFGKNPVSGDLKKDMLRFVNASG
jgi:hypothetical protein